MSKTSYQSNDFFYDIELNDDNKLIYFSITDGAKDFSEVSTIMNSHIGKDIHELSQSLNSQSTFLNLPLMTITKSILELQGVLNYTTQNSKDLICRCFGKYKISILEEPLAEQVAGSACGTCREFIKELMPNEKDISSTDDHFIPIKFHLDADQIIYSYLTEHNISAEFVRGSGTNLFIECSGENQCFDPHQLKTKLTKLIFEQLSIKPSLNLKIS
jgi:hypothetical protein